MYIYIIIYNVYITILTQVLLFFWYPRTELKTSSARGWYRNFIITVARIALSGRQSSLIERRKTAYSNHMEVS